MYDQYPPNQPPPGYGQQPGYGQAPGYGQPGYGHGHGGPNPYEMTASWGTRVLATLIDAVFVLPLAVIGAIAGPGAINVITSLLNLLVVGWLLYRQGTTGQTPGKKYMNISVLREADGLPTGFGGAIVRAIAHIVDGVICLIGYLMPLWDGKKQTIADKLCKTLVIRVG